MIVSFSAGVYVSKHADLVTSSQFNKNEQANLIILKLMKVYFGCVWVLPINVKSVKITGIISSVLVLGPC